MRKYQQKQIFEVLQTIGEAQAAGLYADCQQGAFSVGEFIESIEGEGTETVTLLEEYCEKLFQAGNGEIGGRALSKQLLKIENSVRSELKANKTEMVFLSYKASMSDSIESIYLAAKEDPGCDAYWMPIPYYDKNPDGSFGKMHLEGAECYDENIICTNWQDYDIEARHPDAIFTFNPYDAENHMTSVHPDYYTERLKHLTDLLVYVPYFTISVDPYKVHAPWCIVPGCLDAHKIIVQSEKVRDFYIREYTKVVGDSYGDPNDKFVAIGSPKFDKVINSKRGDFELPEEWQKLITPPRHCGEQSDEAIRSKKAILYNTSVNVIINGKEQYIEKLRYVLDTFKNSDDFILWWRPHPLCMVTFETMRSKFAEDYKAIVDQYRREGWGIYDDTPGLHRALACTDAYFGDGGSMPSLYAVTGKPVVTQDIRKTDNEIPLFFTWLAKDNDGNIWGFDTTKDGLFKLDFQNSTGYYAACSGSVPEIKGNKYLQSAYRYNRIECFDDEVYCFPNSVNDVFVYNRNSNAKIKIPLASDYLLSPEEPGFRIMGKIYRHKNKIYFFGSQVKAVTVIDIETHAVSYNTKLLDTVGVKAQSGKSVKYPIYMSDCDESGNITLLLRDCGHLIQYNLPSQEIKYIASNPVLSECSRAYFDDTCYWLIKKDGETLVRWSPQADDTREYPMPANASDAIANKEQVYSGIIDCGDYLLLLPMYGNAAYKFDKKTAEYSGFNDLPVPEDENNSILKYTRWRIGDKLYIFARFSQTVYKADLPAGKITGHQFKMEESSHERFLSDYLEQYAGGEYADTGRVNIPENTIGDALAFLSAASTEKEAVSNIQQIKIKDLTKNTTGTAGKEIYEYVKTLSF